MDSNVIYATKVLMASHCVAHMKTRDALYGFVHGLLKHGQNEHRMQFVTHLLTDILGTIKDPSSLSQLARLEEDIEDLVDPPDSEGPGTIH
ncbi:MAG: hypothetical protein ACR2PT_23795 [Endozoicomonas sp.]